MIWEQCRYEGTFCDLDLLEVEGGDSPLLGRGLGLGRSARDSGALELSEACSLLESVLKAESSKDELSNDTKTQIRADKLNKITITKRQSTDNLSLFVFSRYTIFAVIFILYHDTVSKQWQFTEKKITTLLCWKLQFWFSLSQIR